MEPSFLLESVEGGEKWGRFSFLGFKPSLIFQVKDREANLERRGVLEILDPGYEPFEHLRRVLADFQGAAAPVLPRFWGGLVGFFSYDMVRYIERLPQLTPGLTMPEARLMLADHLLIFDNLRQSIKVVVLTHCNHDLTVQQQYDQAVADIHGIISRLRQPAPHAEPPPVFHHALTGKPGT